MIRGDCVVSFAGEGKGEMPGRVAWSIRVGVGVALLAALVGCAAPRSPRIATPVHPPAVPSLSQLCVPTPAYAPPGPDDDPWGPFIRTASSRFAVPEPWVREVMRHESGGHQYLDGCLTTSPVGAMGLMQIMPETYEALRVRYGLGDDPYLPRDNIRAGAAYIREMYDRFGAPAFLAAYNAGPEHLDDFLAGAAPLPDETIGYVEAIAPRIGYAPEAIPGWAEARVRFADDHSSDDLNRRELLATGATAVADQADASAVAAVEIAATGEFDRREQNRFAPALSTAATGRPAAATAAANGVWSIQVGAFSSVGEAWTATIAARDHASDLLATARPSVAPTTTAEGTLYRARLYGLSAEGARAACEALVVQRLTCAAVAPAQVDVVRSAAPVVD